MYFIMYLYGGAKRPPITTCTVHTAEAAAEAAEAGASKSVLAMHSISENLYNELPTYQVLHNELPNLAIYYIAVSEFGNSLSWQFIL